MLANIIRSKREATINIVNAVVGVCLALSPWALGFRADRVAEWSAWSAGAIVALVAIGALVAFAEWEEWLNLVLGVWMFVAPQVLGFVHIAAAARAHELAGIIVAVLAAVALWFAHHRPLSTA